MRTPNKDRTAKWRRKQKDAGKMPVTAIVSPATKQLLDRERSRTGETISQAIDRLLLERLQNVSLTPIPNITASNIKPPKPGKPPKPPEPILTKRDILDPAKEHIFDLIIELRGKGLSWSMIGEELFDRGIMPLKGGQKWDTGSLSRIYRRETQRRGIDA